MEEGSCREGPDDGRGAVSDPSLGLPMLGLIVVAIMMGFPTAFTLMGLGMVFGFLAFLTPGQHWYDNRVFDLIAQRTYGVMTNDTLLSVPLFVFMGYIMERAALVDRMFHSVQLAFRRVPASLAVTTLLVCAFWGIASGIVGAVVVLMGVIAMRPMLNAGYDVRLAAGAITAGGTLGILIPPSVMLIVYAAVAGQSIVKLYAAAMLPGFFLTFLYLVYILGWAIINPKIAPKLPPDQYRVAVPEYLRRARARAARQRGAGPRRRRLPARPCAGARAGRATALIVANLLALAVPLMLTVGTFAADVVVRRHLQRARAVAAGAAPAPAAPTAPAAPAARPRPPAAGARRGGEAAGAGRGGEAPTPTSRRSSGRPATAPRRRRVQDRGAARGDDVAARVRRSRPASRVPAHFYAWFWGLAAVGAAPAARVLLAHGRRAARDPEGADRLGGAPRRAHGGRAGGDPVRHHHRHRVGGDRRARRAVPRGDGALRASGVVVEPRRGRRRHRARAGAKGEPWASLLVAASLGGAFAGTVGAGAVVPPDARRSCART